MRSERRACELVGISRSVVRYQVKAKDDDPLRTRLRELALLPQEIVLDNGPEMTSRAMFLWSEQAAVRLRFIDPG